MNNISPSDNKHHFPRNHRPALRFSPKCRTPRGGDLAIAPKKIYQLSDSDLMNAIEKTS